MTALRNEYPHISVVTLCGLFGKRRQWYYASQQSSISERGRRKAILDTVDYYRSLMPRIGCVKLYHLLLEDLGRDIVRGRDSFLRLLSDAGYSLPRAKRRKTTDSKHIYKKYPNLAKHLVAQCINQVWVADITYIWILGDVLYLHLITDAYSHAIIGWCLSCTLEAEGTIHALEMAISIAGGGNLCATIHHSDRGVQYASDAYVAALMSHHIRISMTECYNPTDNAIAERMNGILKVEWIYQSEVYKDYDDALLNIGRSIHIYNTIRPHMSIGMRCPMAVYRGEAAGPNLWKKP